jgi:hypothetical protein
VTDEQDVISRIDQQLYGHDVDFDMLAMLNLLEDAANEIRSLRGEAKHEKEYA